MAAAKMLELKVTNLNNKAENIRSMTESVGLCLTRAFVFTDLMMNWPRQ